MTMRLARIEHRGSARVAGRSARSSGRRATDMGNAILRIARLRYQIFRERFGRDPGPDDPLFFDTSQELPVIANHSEMYRQVSDAAFATRSDFLSVMKFLGLA